MLLEENVSHQKCFSSFIYFETLHKEWKFRQHLENPVSSSHVFPAELILESTQLLFQKFCDRLNFDSILFRNPFELISDLRIKRLRLSYILKNSHYATTNIITWERIYSRNNKYNYATTYIVTQLYSIVTQQFTLFTTLSQ